MTSLAPLMPTSGAAASRRAGVARDVHGPHGEHVRGFGPLGMAIATAAALSLVFQVGHFAEHAFQFAVWLLGDLSNICGRDTPWMSAWAAELVRQIGVLLFPLAEAPRRMMLGMEVLHLIGNSIFLVGLAALYYCLPSRWVRWALYIEGFHLYEHIMLTTTAFFVGKPIGLSTLFGAASVIGDREFAVGVRVSWHFVMNLLPMPFAMVAIMEHWRSAGGVRSMLRHAPGNAAAP